MTPTAADAAGFFFALIGQERSNTCPVSISFREGGDGV